MLNFKQTIHLRCEQSEVLFSLVLWFGVKLAETRSIITRMAAGVV